MTFDSALCSNRGDRDTNEDRAAVLGEGIVYLIADGMGGQAGGQVASELAVDTVDEHMQTLLAAVDREIPSLLDRLFQAANRRIRGVGRQDPSLRDLGTTLTLGLVRDQRLHFCHVGDSRLYHLRDAELKQLTFDHTQAQYLVDRELISTQQAAHSSYKNVLTRYLGTPRNVEPQLGEEQLEESDRLLFCSDGLHGEMENSSIGEILGNNGSAAAIASELVNRAAQERHGNLDNISALVVLVG